MRCEKHFFIKGDTCTINKRSVSTDNREKNFRKCWKLCVYDQILVVQLHGYKLGARAKNVRCEKHFFVKVGACMINKRGVDTENSEQPSRKYQKLRVMGWRNIEIWDFWQETLMISMKEKSEELKLCLRLLVLLWGCILSKSRSALCPFFCRFFAIFCLKTSGFQTKNGKKNDKKMGTGHFGFFKSATG